MVANLWSAEDIIALCENYSKQPCLFNSKLPNYHNKTIRLRALEEIAFRVSEVRPGTTMVDVTAKLASLRSQYVSEYHKVKASRRSGTSADEVYVPSLWYYKHLHFLSEHVVARKSRETAVNSNLKTRGLDRCIHEELQLPSLLEGEHQEGTATDDNYCNEGSDETFFESSTPLQVFVESCSENYSNENQRAQASETVIDIPPIPSGSTREDEATVSKRLKVNHRNKSTKSLSPSQEALKSIAKALETPVTPTVIASPNPPNPSQGLASYICGILDSLKDPVLKIQTTKSILNTLTDAQLQALDCNNRL